MAPNEVNARKQEIDAVDLQSLAYPTDALTMETVRKRDRGQLNWKPDGSHHSSDHKHHGVDELLILVRIEQEYAYNCLHRAAGIRKYDYRHKVHPTELRNDLIEGYVQWGLAPGREAAKLLVDTIREQAEMKVILPPH